MGLFSFLKGNDSKKSLKNLEKMADAVEALESK